MKPNNLRTFFGSAFGQSYYRTPNAKDVDIILHWLDAPSIEINVRKYFSTLYDLLLAGF